MENTIQVKIENFEGPLDLLNHLIEKKKMDVNAINISQIIDDYLSYIHAQKELNLKIKIEFLVMATDLIEIKAYSVLNRGKKLEKIENTEAAQTGNFMSDLAGLLSKYNMNGNSGKSDVLDVKQGKLTLEQINLIFQHMPVDLSFVDENEIVKFYTDTKHRIFPRSAGVIGRDVKNCHPRESVSSVLEIIEAFRSGEQDEVDFWLEMNRKFIYIYYVAVRDENGKFKGVLEMMQDVTRIRGLEGKRTLVTWERPKKSDIKTEETKNSEKNEQKENPYGLTENTVIGEIIDKYPYIKEFMPTLSPTYKKLLDPIQYMIMSKVATLDMIAMRGGFPVEEIIEKISEKIKSEENKK